MKQRFRLIQRAERLNKFYCVDGLTGKRVSLKTQDEDEALQIVQAKNQALRQPAINLQIARAYLSATDPAVTSRTWEHAFGAMIDTKRDQTRSRWLRARGQKVFDLIRHRVLLETRAEHLLEVLNQGTVSTNMFLRRLHNLCLDMNWLPWAILPKKQWPAVHFKSKRAITAQEHARIIARETNPQRRAFYELCWHLGGSQGDIADLTFEDIDWQDHTISYNRSKTNVTSLLHFGEEVAEILRSLSQAGPLFPYLRTVRAGDRATEFKQRCVGLGIQGVSLHSYRYAWAERAKTCGYPERFAQEALGHNSKAVHRAYAKKAKVNLPSLEEYEKLHAGGKVIALPVPNSTPVFAAAPTTQVNGTPPLPNNIAQAAKA
jgi:integrase